MFSLANGMENSNWKWKLSHQCDPTSVSYSLILSWNLMRPSVSVSRQWSVRPDVRKIIASGWRERNFKRIFVDNFASCNGMLMWLAPKNDTESERQNYSLLVTHSQSDRCLRYFHEWNIFSTIESTQQPHMTNPRRKWGKNEGGNSIKFEEQPWTADCTREWCSDFQIYDQSKESRKCWWKWKLV